MQIDSHQHFWHYDPVRDAWIDETMQQIARDFLPKDLEPLLQRNKIDGCIAVQADQSETETQFLLDLALKHPFIKGVVGWVDLFDENLPERLAHFSENKLFKGVRHIVQSEQDGFMLQESFLKGIGRLKDFDLTYDILIYPHQLEEAVQMVRFFPEQKFVLDHIAKPFIKDKKIEPWSDHIRQLAAYQNVYCKMSGMITEADWHHWLLSDFDAYLSVVTEAFGTERLMFGSDWPVCMLAGSYGHVLQIVKEYIKLLSPGDQKKIMGENAVKFYKL
jgi:L-fuconolactonase